MKQLILTSGLLLLACIGHAQYNTFTYGQSLFGTSRSDVSSQTSSVINIGTDEFIDFAFSSLYPTYSFHRIGKWYSNDIYALQYISVGADHEYDKAHWFKTSYSNNALIIRANGNVLVGKNDQSNIAYKLDVAGKVRADEIVVNTTGADFVFDEGYKVRKLEELEGFIKANKHLPDIPPAKTMQEEGMGVSELQTRLLQKIEEMTLHLIEQNKQIKELQKEITELKAVKK